jgi:hypothetical protein
MLFVRLFDRKASFFVKEPCSQQIKPKHSRRSFAQSGAQDDSFEKPTETTEISGQDK